jgi:hypothetical protein
MDSYYEYVYLYSVEYSHCSQIALERRRVETLSRQSLIALEGLYRHLSAEAQKNFRQCLKGLLRQFPDFCKAIRAAELANADGLVKSWRKKVIEKREKDLKFLEELEKKCREKEKQSMTGRGGQKKKVRVIVYMDAYIPVDHQLYKFTPEQAVECDMEEHWHATEGFAKALPPDDRVFEDPGGCGFGKTKETPVLEVMEGTKL